MKFIFILLTITITAAKAINDSNLLYLILNENRKINTINDKTTFKNSLNKGWIFEANKELNILLYILVNKSLSKNIESQKNNTNIFFTTNEEECDVKTASIIYNASFTRGFNRDINFSENNQTNEVYLLVGEVKIKLEHSPKKYYTCLNFDNNYLFAHQGTNNLYTSIITTKNLLPYYVVIIFYFVLLMLSALFSGLNLGLMSLDLTELNILKECGTKRERFYAKKIIPLRKRGNFLLCTILLGNVLVNSTSTLILGSYLDGLFAAIGSTILIVIFGEIIPQAACSRYGLAVGTYTRFITYIFMIITSPLSFPFSLILDRVLGKEIAGEYSRDKVRGMMEQANLADNQKKFISGALDLKNKFVKDVMVPINNVFKLDINSCLDFDTFREIGEHGYSRIPLYEHTE